MPADPTGRAAATEVLVRVSQGQSLTAALGESVDKLKDPRERALARELCYGVMRWRPRLRAITDQLLKKPLREKDADVSSLLLLGVYQLLHTRHPPHAAVAETVAVADVRGKPWAKGLINGVLRNFQRRREEILAIVDRKAHVRLAHPRWLVAEIENAWPGDWERILEENNRQAPMVLRVNAKRISREDYLRRHPDLAAPVPGTETAARLFEARDVSRIPGFAEGIVSVQDAGAQFAADLLGLASGQRVLDACAAPGGKSAHILEREPGAVLTAVEREAVRLTRTEETLRRLGLGAELVRADAGSPDGWWNGQPFDRILLDVPCSGSGVIRRRPDIKFHRRPGDIDQYVAEQARLLNALWPLLVPGGLLLYVTCSVLPRENQQCIRRFLAEHPDARESLLDVDWGRADWGRGQQGPGRQILPGENGMDGFFYARIEKR
uniref:16S rRNA (cytosine(967)-C(5))-methyltransferase n=1 Tax=Candidatus Kentrum sp. DK TaxID=2126562 RepID=A0A450STM8_9GAMM|nr:MAG: 16S rRNA m(5)C-967 methyltransferase [Candidatus Kentron sp. DK]